MNQTEERGRNSRQAKRPQIEERENLWSRTKGKKTSRQQEKGGGVDGDCGRGVPATKDGILGVIGSMCGGTGIFVAARSIPDGCTTSRSTMMT